MARSSPTSRMGCFLKAEDASVTFRVDGRCPLQNFSCPYLRCLVPDEANYVMREVHEGVCGNCLGARSLVYKLIQVGYYLPCRRAPIPT